MAGKLYNRAGVLTTTAGTGTVTLGAALAAGTALNSAVFRTFASAGVADGTVVRYLILDANGAWEYGTGTYTSAGTTLSRTLGASSTGALLVLSGSAQVFITAIAEDIVSGPATSTDRAIAIYNGTTGLLLQDSTATIDAGGIVTVTTDVGGTNFATATLNVQTTCSGTPAAGFGTGILYYAETAPGNIENIGNMYAYLTDVTGAAEDSNYIFYVMANGTAGNPMFIMRGGSNGGAGDNVSIRPFGVGPFAEFTLDRHFHVEADNAATATVTYLGRFTSTSQGTPAVGIGAGLELEVEAQAGVNKVIATAEAVTTNVGAGTEAGDLVFRSMTAGAAANEKGRTGFMPVSMIQTDNLTLLASYSVVVNLLYTIPTGLLLTLGANSVMRIL